jgi:photosystem II stability/assembly factor-like uncharacterized protein
MKTKTILSFVILLSLLTIQSNFSQWQPTALNTGSIYTLAKTQTHIIAGALGIYTSTNEGLSWVYTDIEGRIYDVCANDNYAFAMSISQNSNVYRSTNNGFNWTLTAPLSAADGLSYIAMDGSVVYVGTYNYGIRRSTDNGASWYVLPGITGSIDPIAAAGNNIFAVKNYSTLYRSTNNGNNWQPTTFTSPYIIALAIDGNRIYAGTVDSGMYISTNNGNTWQRSELNNRSIKCIELYGKNVFAGTFSGFYTSSNNGTTWAAKSEGLTNPFINALLIKGNYIYAATYGAGVYKRPLSELMGIYIISTEVPAKYDLSQNYPNPFNPTTNIKFSIPVSGYTTLNVYDPGGKLISTLVNSELNAGTYEADFDGSNIASGIYFYTLSSGNYIKTNKMILVK